MKSRKLTRSALPNKLPFGLISKGSNPKINLESNQVPSVGRQHLGATILLSARRPGMQTLKKMVAQINLEGREPTEIEKDFLTARCKTLFTVPGLTYEDLLRPKGTWNMEAEGDEEDEDAAAPPEPTEPEEPGEEGEEEQGNDPDTDPENDPAATDPTEPVEPEAPSTSEADNQPLATEVEPTEPEHKVNVVMRAGEVEINIEDAMDKYQALNDSVVADITTYAISEYVRIKDEFCKRYDELNRLRSKVAMRKSITSTVPLALNDVYHLGTDFPLMLQRLTDLSHCFLRLADSFYQRSLTSALQKYEAGLAAEGADIIKGGILELVDLQTLGSVFKLQDVVAEEGVSVELLVPADLPDAMSSVEISITPHQLTRLNNVALDLIGTIKDSTFLASFEALATRANALPQPEATSGAEQDPYVFIRNFASIFPMQNVYILQGILTTLEQLTYLNECVSESADV